jgi:hypothetical protein
LVDQYRSRILLALINHQCILTHGSTPFAVSLTAKKSLQLLVAGDLAPVFDDEPVRAQARVCGNIEATGRLKISGLDYAVSAPKGKRRLSTGRVDPTPRLAFSLALARSPGHASGTMAVVPGLRFSDNCR